MTRRFFAAVAAGVVTAAIATPAEAAPKRCDPLGGGECLLPFPNDYFTKRDRSTETGRRTPSSRNSPLNCLVMQITRSAELK